MAASQQIDSTLSPGGHASAVDLLIAIAGPVDDERLLEHSAPAIEQWIAGRAAAGGVRIAVASPAANQTEATTHPVAEASGVQFLHYPLSPSAQAALPWLAAPAAYHEIARVAAAAGAKACVVLAQDLAAMDAASIGALAAPLLDGSALISVPIYPAGKYEALLNSGLLYPFTRALYGNHLRHPFAVDFGIAGNMVARLAAGTGRYAAQAIQSPALDAAASGLSIAQACVSVMHTSRNDDVDLSTVLARLCGSLFEDAERNAAAWQKVRQAQPALIHGRPSAAVEDGAGVDVRPLIESFNLGFRNLREVWGLVLPPVTLLELQRLTRLPAEQFLMPDSLWAKIVYDFALAYRLRSISRTHVLGALTPLYLGWVASYTGEVRAMDAAEVERRIERLATAYEEAKTYFVSRWRWPDRFNP